MAWWNRTKVFGLIVACSMTPMCAMIGADLFAGDEQPDPDSVAVVRENIGKLELELRAAIVKKGEPAIVLLNQMNKHYVKGEHADVINLGKRIEELDKYGDKYGWSAAVYATMAHSYAILGGKAENDGDLKSALVYFKRAASCNRSFADAVARYRNMPGHAREHIDDVQKLYK